MRGEANASRRFGEPGDQRRRPRRRVPQRRQRAERDAREGRAGRRDDERGLRERRRPSRPGVRAAARLIKVLIAEDQAMIRGALAALLAREEDIEVVAQVERGDRVVDEALKTSPDVALLD